MQVADELPIHLFATPAEFEAWLEGDGASSDGIWLKIAKKGAAEPSVTYAEALELALCFGWIDSQKKGLDETHFLSQVPTGKVLIDRLARDSRKFNVRALFASQLAGDLLRVSGFA